MCGVCCVTLCYILQEKFSENIFRRDKEPMMRRKRLRHLLLLIYLQQPIELAHNVPNLQTSAQVPFPGFVKFVPALAYYFCLDFPTSPSQPGTSDLAEP